MDEEVLGSFLEEEEPSVVHIAEALPSNWKPEDFADFDEDLMSEEERQKAYEPDYIPGGSSFDTEDESYQGPLPIPKGYFYKDRFVPPDIERKDYIARLHEAAVSYQYTNYAPIDSHDIVHIDRTYSINMYIMEMTQIMSIFRKYYGRGKIYIINGFRSPHDIGIGEHSVGIALDIKADNMEHARRIMNAAFMTGFPNIIPNGEMARGDGYVHIDLGKKGDYNYGSGTYEGPWS